MATFDFGAARARVRRLVRRKRVKSIGHILIPLTAHIGSLVTIFVAWFMRTGSFAFHANDRKDWIITAILVSVAISGVLLLARQLSTPRSFVATRRELSDLLAVARADAEASVTSIGGDLSWLREDVEVLRSLREQRPTLSLKVYCNRQRISPQVIDLIQTLGKVGIEFVSYPASMKPTIKCMLVDKEHPDSRRLHTYVRHGDIVVGSPREEHEFLWQSFGAESEFVTEAVMAFEKAIETSGSKAIRVGISGLNNVGKTQLSGKLYDLLRDKVQVKLYPDVFRSVEGTTLEDNYSILFLQLANEVEEEAEVAIYDRTLVDNLCFFQLRAGPNHRLYRDLAPRIAAKMSRFDFVIDVRAPGEDEIKPTKLVSAEDRKLVRVWLDGFFATYGIPKLDVTISPDNFKQDIEKATADIADRIMRTQLVRRMIR